MSNVLDNILTIQSELAGRRWGAVSSAEHVWGPLSVPVMAGNNQAAVSNRRLPLALILPMDGAVDPEHGEEPNLSRQSIRVRIVCAVAGDEIGQNALLGANKTSGTDSSKGRGLLEIERELLGVIQFLNVQRDLMIQFRAASFAVTQRDEEGRHIAIRDYLFELWTPMVEES